MTWLPAAEPPSEPPAAPEPTPPRCLGVELAVDVIAPDDSSRRRITLHCRADEAVLSVVSHCPDCESTPSELTLDVAQADALWDELEPALETAECPDDPGRATLELRSPARSLSCHSADLPPTWRALRETLERTFRAVVDAHRDWSPYSADCWPHSADCWPDSAD
ncbi:hypothetical protein DB32_007967 [Sandaracinus amylolyticus]|uniref:Uncharacterized protein n=1 Tax=Sandaracinus amylolyticus TaxID=927083 RepID=A0A0F6W9E5_9BACT|nr:hypothetical protein DB32_007967 [Sandaracinus amylolyticus]